MQLLSLQGVSKYFSERCLFKDVSFSVESGRHIGVVGANGTGKTTLFKMITGREEYDSGQIVVSKSARLGYMEQQITSQGDCTAYDYVEQVFSHLIKAEKELDEVNEKLLLSSDGELISRQLQLSEYLSSNGGLTYKNRIRATLKGLGFEEDDFGRSISEFSGGQRSKLALARLLLSDTNLMLLDEPTNHLDIPAVTWLEGFLSGYQGAFMVITHDRFFLDRVTDATIELENGKINYFSGKYTVYKEIKKQRAEAVKKEYDEKLKEIKRLEGIVEQQRSFNRERNIRMAESKLKVIDRIKESLVVPPEEEKTVSFDFKCRENGPYEVLKADSLSLSFGEKNIFSNLGLKLFKGEKVFLVGENGCGKTSLLRLLNGEYKSSDGGNITFGPGVKLAYFDQVQSSLSPNKTALDEVWDKYPDMNESSLRSAFAAFLMRGDDVYKKISSLSGGERARVQLLEIVLSKADLLMLDEPTNHLDIASKEAVEQALLGYNGTVIAVSHDRYFINRLADRIYAFKNGRLVEYKGNYDYFLEKTQDEENPLNDDREAGDNKKSRVFDNSSVSGTSKTPGKTAAAGQESDKNEKIADKSVNLSSGAAEYRRAKEELSRIRKLKSTVAQSEKQLDLISKRKDEINEEMLLSSDNYQRLEELTHELAECEQRENEIMAEWDKAVSELEKAGQN